MTIRFDPKFENGKVRPHPTKPDTRYYGKICLKHPQLEGERRLKSAACVACHRERNMKYAAKPEVKALNAAVRRSERRIQSEEKKAQDTLHRTIRVRASQIAFREMGSERYWPDYYQRAIDELRAQGHIPELNT